MKKDIATVKEPTRRLILLVHTPPKNTIAHRPYYLYNPKCKYFSATSTHLAYRYKK